MGRVACPTSLASFLDEIGWHRLLQNICLALGDRLLRDEQGAGPATWMETWLAGRYQLGSKHCPAKSDFSCTLSHTLLHELEVKKRGKTTAGTFADDTQIGRVERV